MSGGIYNYPDHVLAAKALTLASDKQQRPRLLALLGVLVGRIQMLEDVLWDVHEDTWLDTATGDALDQLGAIVGEARNDRPDVVYRLWIKAKARANRSNGRIDDSLEIMRLILEPEATVEYLDQDPRDAEYTIQVGSTSIDLTEAKQILELARPAGVLLHLVSEAGADAFRFDVGPGFGVGLFAGVV